MLYHILSPVGWDPSPLLAHTVHDLAGLTPDQIRGLVEGGIVKPLVGTPIEEIERFKPYADGLKEAGILTDQEFREADNALLKTVYRWYDEEIEALKRGPQTELPQRNPTGVKNHTNDSVPREGKFKQGPSHEAAPEED